MMKCGEALWRDSSVLILKEFRGVCFPWVTVHNPPFPSQYNSRRQYEAEHGSGSRLYTGCFMNDVARDAPFSTKVEFSLTFSVFEARGDALQFARSPNFLGLSQSPGLLSRGT